MAGAGGSGGTAGEPGTGGTGGTGGAGGTAGTGGDGGSITPDAGRFPATAPFYADVSDAPRAADSASIIAGVQSRGGWGLGRFQIDFSMEVLVADAGTARRSFVPDEESFWSPDCDTAPVPLPAGGRLEGESGYACDGGGDCHLLVHQGNRLYEMGRANLVGTSFVGGCLVVWDLGRDYWAPASPPSFGRGDGCTSADAAGLPIAPLLFTADEVAAGEIAHAIRFILPNDRIRHRTYVHPGTHATPTASGGTDTPPYGSRWRLKADFDESRLPTEGAKVVARALKRYGMILSDGGKVALTAQADTSSTAKWDGLLGSRDLEAIAVTDFEVVDGGAAYAWGIGDTECNRDPVGD